MQFVRIDPAHVAKTHAAFVNLWNVKSCDFGLNNHTLRNDAQYIFQIAVAKMGS